MPDGATFDTVVLIVVPGGMYEVGKLKSVEPEYPAIAGKGTVATTAGTATTVAVDVNGATDAIGTGVGDAAGPLGLGELFELPHALSVMVKAANATAFR